MKYCVTCARSAKSHVASRWKSRYCGSTTSSASYENLESAFSSSDYRLSNDNMFV